MSTVLDELIVSLKYQVTGAKAAESTAKNVAKATSNIGVAAARVGQQLSRASGMWAKSFGNFGRSFSGVSRGVTKEAEATSGGVNKLTVAWQGLLAIGAVAWARGQANELMDVASQLSKISNELGISTDAVQELNYAAIDADIGIEDLQTGMRGLSRGLLSAAKGSKEAAGNFAGIGVNVKELAALSADKQFEAMADAISKIEDPGMRTATAMRVFGRSGATLLPLLNQGSAGIATLRGEFRQLGGGLSEDAIDTLGDLEKNIKMMNASMLAFKASLVTLFVPAFVRVQKLFGAFEHQVMSLNKKANILQVVGIAGLIVGFVKLYKVLNALSSGSVLKDLLGLGKWVLLGAVIAGIAILIQDIYTGLTGGKSAIFQWIDSWAGLGTIDGWIRNIKAGMEEIQRLGTGGAIGQALGDLRDMWGKTGEDEGAIEGMQAALSKLRNDPKSMGLDVSTPAGKAAQAEMIDRTQERLRKKLVSVSGSSDRDTPLRAMGRGLGAAAQGLGQVTEVIGSEVPAAVRSAAPQTAAPISVQISPTINARTTVNPQELERLMSNAISEGGQKAARNIAAASRR